MSVASFVTEYFVLSSASSFLGRFGILTAESPDCKRGGGPFLLARNKDAKPAGFFAFDNLRQVLFFDFFRVKETGCHLWQVSCFAKPQKINSHGYYRIIYRTKAVPLHSLVSTGFRLNHRRIQGSILTADTKDEFTPYQT